jgi:hypothetical protein
MKSYIIKKFFGVMVFGHASQKQRYKCSMLDSQIQSVIVCQPKSMASQNSWQVSFDQVSQYPV